METIIRQISSLYKIRDLSDLTAAKERTAVKLFRNEQASYQVCLYTREERHHRFSVDADGLDAECYFVKNGVMDYPCYEDHDEDLLTEEPGPMPDLLVPAEACDFQQSTRDSVVTMWIRLSVPKDAEAGTRRIRVTVQTEEENETSEAVLTAEIYPFTLPEQKTMFSQWFHTDCIAEAYQLTPWSEAHWEMTGRFMKAARNLGISLILTPVLTPALDTKVGTERLCTQLAVITEQDGRYCFDFSRVGRYIDLARANGIENFEISHLFSQWGLKAAPNIYVDGRLKFGWHTDSKGPEYRDFLTQFLPALVAYLKEKDAFSHAYFHISDEPGEGEELENYRYAAGLVRPYLEGRPVMDAISNIEFYRQGLMDIPVTASNHMVPFLQEKIENQWTYYCCGQYKKTGNRFLAFPSYRNRILGTQIYRHNVKGFMHWGFNFYHSAVSRYQIDPYLTTSGDRSWPSGDPFSVYPGPEGPYYSLRSIIFREALQDVEIFRMLEAKTSREYVEKKIDEAAGYELTFEEYPRNYDYIEDLIASVREEIIHGEA